MAVEVAELFWLMLATYAVVGAVSALVVLWLGQGRLDATALAAPWRVKLLWTPGFIALWPLLLGRLLGWRPREDRA